MWEKYYCPTGRDIDDVKSSVKSILTLEEHTACVFLCHLSSIDSPDKSFINNVGTALDWVRLNARSLFFSFTGGVCVCVCVQLSSWKRLFLLKPTNPATEINKLRNINTRLNLILTRYRIQPPQRTLASTVIIPGLLCTFVIICISENEFVWEGTRSKGSVFVRLCKGNCFVQAALMVKLVERM